MTSMGVFEVMSIFSETSHFSVIEPHTHRQRPTDLTISFEKAAQKSGIFGKKRLKSRFSLSMHKSESFLTPIWSLIGFGWTSDGFNGSLCFSEISDIE